MFFDGGSLAVVYTESVVGRGGLAGAVCLEILGGQGGG